MKKSDQAYKTVNSMLQKKGISRYIIFHPSAQYYYKIYPKHLRDKLLFFLNTLYIPILITGTNSKIDLNIKTELSLLPNIFGLFSDTLLILNNLLSQRGGTKKTLSRLIPNLSNGSYKKGDTILT